MERSRSNDEIRNRRSMNNKVPAGWLDYSPLNTWIENTRFVPFKCPLRWVNQSYEILINKTGFPINDLIDRLENQGRKIDNLIGIHCTHGINRSGYFIVRYLIEILGQQPDNAIAGKFLLFVSSSSSSSDQEDDDYYMERDRPLPYSRPSIDPTLNDISSDTSKILV
ncbi:unnamed protein product [Rotaria sp. Silwood1]|nr:unnamed protein product [Rotaria sp. Silwood1]CAF3986552.1 unnamed protein product [Rotaria sp. Silwood1]CAF5021002.1 unnamed protein product [Rotaria sp. Silwood1]